MYKFIFVIFSIFYFFNSSYTQSSKNIRAVELRGALRFERTCFDVYYYDLFLKIIPELKYIDGHNKIYFKTKDSTSKIQIDLYQNLQISKILFNNEAINFTREYDAVWVTFPVQLQKNEAYFIDVFYEGYPKSDYGDYGRYGFHWGKNEGKDLVGIACESVGASLWWPNKDHLSDKPDSMRLHWKVPNDLICISNGNLEKVTKLAYDSTFFTHHYLIKNPINNYCVTIYLGNYKEIKDVYYSPITKKTYPISYFYYNVSDDQALKYFRFTKLFLAYFEEIYGEYPFWDDKFSVVQSNYPGMEHQGCLAIGNISLNYNNWYYGLILDYSSTLIHEIAHEWWGNSVSVNDMADIWMHEGFATYSEILFVEKIYGKSKYTQIINFIKTKSNFDPLVGKRDINDNIINDGNVYMNGVVFLDKLRKKIGKDDVFFDILKSFQTNFRKKNINTKDFLMMVNEKTGKDFTAFFNIKVY